MAYIKKYQGQNAWNGPFPNKANEFCSNKLLQDLKIGADGTVLEIHHTGRPHEDGDKKGESAPAGFTRVGRPSSCGGGTSEEMAKAGWVGMYLKEDRDSCTLNGEIREVDTDVLLEVVVSGQQLSVRPFRPAFAMEEKCGV